MNRTTRAQRINARYEKILAEAARLKTATRFNATSRTQSMTYADRVRELEREGLTTSDAQGAADAEQMQGRVFDFDPRYPLDSMPARRLCPATRWPFKGGR